MDHPSNSRSPGASFEGQKTRKHNWNRICHQDFIEKFHCSDIAVGAIFSWRPSCALGDERIWQRKVIDLRGNQRISYFCTQLFHNCCKAGHVVSQPFSGWIDRFGKKDQFQDLSVSNYLPLDRKIWNHLGLHNFSQIWLISTGLVSIMDTGSTFVRWSIFW